MADMVVYVLGRHYANTYHGITQRLEDKSLIATFFGIIKYMLLFILLVIAPAERSRRRRFAKFIVLFGSLYAWANLDFFSLVIDQDDQEAELAKQSFKENSIPIYGKVVFTSYKRDESPQKRIIVVAEKISAHTNGYIVIVQLNDSIYTYDGLETIYHHFNDYSHDTYDSTFRTNIQEKVPDLSNCLQFIFDFPHPIKRIPELPAIDKYVKIMYDPLKNGIEMYTDSATATTPTFDSIPAVTSK